MDDHEQLARQVKEIKGVVARMRQGCNHKEEDVLFNQDDQ